MAAQSLPSKREAVILLQKAGEQTLLAVPGRPSFHIVAKLHHVVGTNSFEGSYELLWATPERFREEFRLGDAGETDVALEDKIYVLRNTPTPIDTLFLIRALTGLPNGKTTAVNRRVTKVYGSGADGHDLTCDSIASITLCTAAALVAWKKSACAGVKLAAEGWAAVGSVAGVVCGASVFCRATRSVRFRSS